VKLLSRFKVFSAMVLAASLALPMSACTRYVSPDGQPVGFMGLGPAHSDSRAVSDYSYVLSSFSLRYPSNWAILFAYLWPLLMLGYRSRPTRPVLNLVMWWVQLPLLAGSAATIGFVVFWGSPWGSIATGAYVAWAALSVYAIAWLLGGILNLRFRGRGREPNQRSQASAGAHVLDGAAPTSARRA
jgi:hypothetical protein